jgi:hypothetical protein
LKTRGWSKLFNILVYLNHERYILDVKACKLLNNNAPRIEVEKSITSNILVHQLYQKGSFFFGKAIREREEWRKLITG